MKIANIREFRNKATSYLKENDTVLITRHGKITGLLYPIKETDTLPNDLRQEVRKVLSSAGQRDTNLYFLQELKRILKPQKVNIEDIYTLQKEWKFKGNLSDEITAEREKR
jgi:hypothetical protein